MSTLLMIPHIVSSHCTALLAGLVLTVSALAGSSGQLRELIDEVAGDDAGGVSVMSRATALRGPSAGGSACHRASVLAHGAYTMSISMGISGHWLKQSG